MHLFSYRQWIPHKPRVGVLKPVFSPGSQNWLHYFLARQSLEVFYAKTSPAVNAKLTLSSILCLKDV